MKALVSGQAGLALLIDGQRVFSVDIDSSEPVERSRAEAGYLFGGATDVTEIPNITVAKAVDALDLLWRKDRALQLMLILLDRHGDAEARQLAAECLGDMLADSQVVEFLCNRLYSAPL